MKRPLSVVRRLEPSEVELHFQHHQRRRDAACSVCRTRRPSLRFVPPMDAEGVAGTLETEIRIQEAWELIRRVAREDATRRNPAAT